MNANYEIAKEDIALSKVLEGEIAGETTYLHNLKAGESRVLVPCPREARVLIVTSGTASVNGEEAEVRTTLAFAPGSWIALSAAESAQVFELRWALNEDECCAEGKLPYRLAYADARKYTEACKSPKTTSRMLLPEGLVPRLAIGSVETYGTDLIAKHTHPYVDQLFFSFPENDMEVLIDEGALPMKGNTLLHIPLASDHGVRVGEDGCAHYIWIDFIIDRRGIDFLNNEHHML